MGEVPQDPERRVVELSERRHSDAPAGDPAGSSGVEALVIVLDAGGRIVQFNEPCERLMGVRAAEAVGRTIADLLSASGEAGALEDLHGAASGALGPEQLREWTDRFGTRRRIAWSSTYPRTIGGQVETVVCVGFEIQPASAGEFDVGTWEPPASEVEALERLLAARPAALAHPQVGRAVRWILEHFCEPISLRDVASAVSYSPAYLTDLFRKATGFPVQAWIIGSRMLEARKLLAATTASLSEIAASIGYREVSHFARQFRQYHGQAPGAWRSDLAARRPALRALE